LISKKNAKTFSPLFSPLTLHPNPTPTSIPDFDTFKYNMENHGFGSIRRFITEFFPVAKNTFKRLHLNLVLTWPALGDLIRIAADGGSGDGKADPDATFAFDLKAAITFKNILGNLPGMAEIQRKTTPCDTFCGRYEADVTASGMFDFPEWRLAFPEPSYIEWLSSLNSVQQTLLIGCCGFVGIAAQLDNILVEAVVAEEDAYKCNVNDAPSSCTSTIPLSKTSIELSLVWVLEGAKLLAFGPFMFKFNYDMQKCISTGTKRWVECAGEFFGPWGELSAYRVLRDKQRFDLWKKKLETSSPMEKDYELMVGCSLYMLKLQKKNGKTPVKENRIPATIGTSGKAKTTYDTVCTAGKLLNAMPYEAGMACKAHVSESACDGEAECEWYGFDPKNGAYDIINYVKPFPMGCFVRRTYAQAYSFASCKTLSTTPYQNGLGIAPFGGNKLAAAVADAALGNAPPKAAPIAVSQLFVYGEPTFPDGFSPFIKVDGTLKIRFESTGFVNDDYQCKTKAGGLAKSEFPLLITGKYDGIMTKKGKWFDPSKPSGKADAKTGVDLYAYGKCTTVPEEWRGTKVDEAQHWQLALNELIKMHTGIDVQWTEDQNMVLTLAALRELQVDGALSKYSDWREWLVTQTTSKSPLAKSTAGVKKKSPTASRFSLVATLPDFNVKQAICLAFGVDPGFTIKGAPSPNNACAKFFGSQLSKVTGGFIPAQVTDFLVNAIGSLGLGRPQITFAPPNNVGSCQSHKDADAATCKAIKDAKTCNDGSNIVTKHFNGGKCVWRVGFGTVLFVCGHILRVRGWYWALYRLE
jgi:hypothetical protein